MSPKEFHALCKRYQEHEERMDRRIATLQAFYINVNSAKDARKFTTDDFMGKTKKEKQFPSDKQLEANLTAMFGVGPSKPKAERSRKVIRKPK